TNDLDVETLELLEELLADYPGTLLLVSHDRDFLDNVVTSTLVLEGEGRVGEYVGGYSDWLRQRPPPPAPTPQPQQSPAPPRAAPSSTAGSAAPGCGKARAAWASTWAAIPTGCVSGHRHQRRHRSRSSRLLRPGPRRRSPHRRRPRRSQRAGSATATRANSSS